MSACDCGPKIDFYPITERDDEVCFKGLYDGVGQCFTTPSGQRYEPCEATFYLKRKGNPNGWLWVYLYDVTRGRCGIDCVPDETRLICSTLAIDAMSVSTSWTLYDFVFKGCDCLEADHCYAVVLMAWGGFDASNHVCVGIDKTMPTHAGNFVAHRPSWGNWRPTAGVDTIFYICGNECGSADRGGNAPSPAQAKAMQEGPRKTIWYNAEHLVLQVRSNLGKNIILPCRVNGFVGRLAQPIIVVVKGSLGIPAFFETIVKSGIKRYYEETLHVMGKLGIKYEETIAVEEDVRGYLLSQNATVRNLQETLISFIETLSKEQDETRKELVSHKKKEKKKKRLRELSDQVKEV